MIPRSKKIMGWAMLVGIITFCVMLFYAFNSPLDWKSHKLGTYLFIACCLFLVAYSHPVGGQYPV